MLMTGVLAGVMIGIHPDIGKSFSKVMVVDLTSVFAFRITSVVNV